MAEYIERGQIKYEQWSVGPLCEPLMVVRKKPIDSIPAADVAPVVRCRWCESHHWEQEPCHGKNSAFLREVECRSNSGLLLRRRETEGR